MQVTVNGLQEECSAGANLLELLSRFNIIPERVAVELNLAVVDRKQWDRIFLKEGDNVEIINFVGGG